MKKAKVFSIILIATTISQLIYGCKSNMTNQAKISSENIRPITFSFYDVDLNNDIDFTDPVAKEITNKTGVTLKITHPVGGDNEKIPLMIASKDYPDLIFAKGDTSKLVNAGALIRLDSYISNEGANIKKLYGDYINRLKFSKNDPAIYFLGSCNISSTILKTNGSLQIQNAVLKDQGYPIIKTLADYKNVIKSYIDKYPTIDGQTTIGLSLCADDWKWLITVGNPAGFAAGYPDDGQWVVDHATDVAEYKFLAPEIRDYFKWLNDMNASGLLDKDSFTQKYEQYITKLSTGRVLGTADQEWDYNEAMIALVGNNKSERTMAPLPITTKQDIKSKCLYDAGYLGAAGVAITTACKDPERAFKFLDWMASDEARVLTNLGIEGINYKIDKGKRTVPVEEQKKKNSDKDYSSKTGVGLYVYPFPQKGDGFMDSYGNEYSTITAESIILNYNEAEKETLAAYKIAMFKDLFPQSKEFKVSDFGTAYNVPIPAESDLTDTQKKLDDYCRKAVPQAILCNPDEFDSQWEKIVTDLKELGADKAGEEMTELIQERAALWK